MMYNSLYQHDGEPESLLAKAKRVKELCEELAAEFYSDSRRDDWKKERFLPEGVRVELRNITLAFEAMRLPLDRLKAAIENEQAKQIQIESNATGDGAEVTNGLL